MFSFGKDYSHVPKKIPPPGRIPLIVGLAEFGVLFRVEPRTGDTWTRRAREVRADPNSTPERREEVLPEPDLVLSNRCQGWLVSRLQIWAENTGRPIYVDDLLEHRKATAGAPPSRYEN
jgi:hypothetical protein